MQTLTVNPEFKDLSPPLSHEEYAGLEKSIVAEGVRDSIVTWCGTIVDGHNRYEICQKHGIDFKTTEHEFEDETAAKEWIIRNQLARRNITAYVRAELILKLKPALAAEAKERQIRKPDNFVVPNLAQQNKPEKTRDELAKLANISHGNLARVEVIQRKAAPEVKEALRKGDMSINQAYTNIKKTEQLEQAKQHVLEQTRASVETEPPKIYQMDCTDFLSKYEAESVDLLITDPPYSTDVEDMDKFISRWYHKALSKVKKTGFAYIFIGAYPDEVRAYLTAMVPNNIKLEQILVWTYRNTLGNNPKGKYKLNYQDCLFFRGINAPDLNCPITNEQWAVQDINAPDGRQGDRYHAWQKPMEIAERFIRHTTMDRSKVIDPFACTGTFLLAANKLGRNAAGCDIDQSAIEIAVTRGCVHGR